MRFTRLTAHAHGPFAGETLTPASGFTVVWGLNEAGKSSWHSAAHLSITGLSRKRGRPTKGEQQIIDRRKPRTGDQWRLEAGLHLDDGDDLTVTWDLNQRVAKVLDGLGRDRSNEWMTDGAPDLARIVGLDRASFLATASVRQSDLLRVHEDADLLQELLQKATTSADADSTASSAIALIDQCRKEQVGLERENSTKPLMEARRRVEATSRALSTAQDAHRDRLDLLAALTDRRAELADRQAESEVLQLALAVAEARSRHDDLLRQRDDLESLSRRVEDLAIQVDHFAHREQVLLTAHRHAAQVETLAAIERQVTETATVRQAAVEAEGTHQALTHRQAWIEHERANRAAQRSRQRLARATKLQTRHPVAPTLPTDQDKVARQAHVLVERWTTRPTVPALAGPTAAEIAQQLAALPKVSSAETAVPEGHQVAGPPSDDRTTMARRASTNTPVAIGGIGIAVLGLVLGVVVHPALYLLAVAGAVAALLAARHRTKPADDNATAAFQERLERAEAAERSGRHDTLSAQLAHRSGQEQQVVDVEATLHQLDQDLRATAAAIGVSADLTGSQQAESIAQWLTEYADHRRLLHAANGEWAELTNLLDGATLNDLASEAEHDEQLRQERAAAVRGLDQPTDDLQGIEDRVLREQLHQLAGATADAGREVARLRSQLPREDPQLALSAARSGVDDTHRQFRELDALAAEQLAESSIHDIDTQLVACRREHDERRRARDESAGQLRQLRAAAPHGSPPPPSVLTTSPGSDPANAVLTAAAQIDKLERAFAGRPAHAVVGFTLDALPPIEKLHAQIDAVASQESQLHHLVAGLDGRLQERDAPGAAADPAAAEENHEAALRELARVRELAEVLDETKSLLVTAEDRVHRDIAPRLNAAINRWLPRIFGDRYTKVLIDPANLDVQVFSAGDAQRADLLSQGTTEQFYLLLRVALTETLTSASDESCPLLLDDITVNFDRERKIAILDLLREVATERQVILFTQEDDVRTWAETNLSGTDALIELAGRVSA